MPVKVEQIDDYLFSDTVQSKKKESCSDGITSQGQYPGYPSMCSVSQVQTMTKRRMKEMSFQLFC